MNRWFALALLLMLQTAQTAEEWGQTLATTSSLRTGGARLVASDALSLDGGDSALITYWELLQDTGDLDIYRCVDEVGQDFSLHRQTCWKVLTPAAPRPAQTN